MQNRVEPPVLISRIMTFVLAASAVVLVVLFTTLYKMFPLNRPQIFFLRTVVRDNYDVKLVEMPPESIHLDNYKRAFVREYIRHRNEIFTDFDVMQKKWNAIDGNVRTMSTEEVYADFTKTAMFNAMMGGGMPNFDFRCPVIFDGAPIPMPAEDGRDTTTDTFLVKFHYFCADNTGRTPEKGYTIKMKIKSDEGTSIKWTDRIENPLGLRVAEYTISSGDSDPLDMKFLMTE